jgi:chaperonin GroES
MVKIKPLDDRVVIEVLEAEEKTAGGILLPDTAKEKPQKGTIVAIGPGKLLDNGERAPFSVKVKDTVLFGKYSGQDIQVGDSEYKIMRENEILARFE